MAKKKETDPNSLLRDIIDKRIKEKKKAADIKITPRPNDIQGLKENKSNTTKKYGPGPRIVADIEKGIEKTLKNIAEAKPKIEQNKKTITPEELLRLKKARMQFIKQSKYKEMKKKVEKEVKEVKENEKENQEAAKAEKVKEKPSLGNKKITNQQEFIKTGVEGLDLLFEEGRGIPKGTAVLVVGGPGTGKTLFCLHLLNYACSTGEKCLYLSFEENEERLKQHMRDFGWDPEGFEKKGLLVIKRIDPFEISRSIEALLAQSRGELMIDIEGISSFMPKNFKPDRIIIDSVTALTAAFAQSDSSYRSYIEQSFLYMEKLGATTFLISETEDAPKKLSPSGIEEFLADGVIIIYNIRNEGVRERAIEVLKMRGSKFQEKIVAMQITDTGIVVYPNQQVFGALNQ